MTLKVRRRPVAGDVRAAGCAVVLVAFSVVFAVAAVPALPGVRERGLPAADARTR